MMATAGGDERLKSGDGLDPHTRALRWAWRAFLLLLPITSPVAFGGTDGAIRPPSAVLALLVLPWLLWAHGREWARDRAVHISGIAIAWAVIVGGLVLCTVVPHTPAAASHILPGYLREVGALAVGAACYLFARAQLRSVSDVIAVLPWLFVGFGASVALAVCQSWTDGQGTMLRQLIVWISIPFSSQYSDTAFLHGRGNGLAYEPSYLASQLSLLLVLGPLLYICAPSQRKLATAWWCLAAFGATASASRYGMLASCAFSIVGIVSVGFCAGFRTQRYACLVAAVLCSLVCGWVAIHGNAYARSLLEFLLPPSVVKSLPSFLPPPSQAESLAHTAFPRHATAIAGINMFIDRPILGHGLGSTAATLPAYLPQWSHNWVEIRPWCDAENPQRAKQFSLSIKLVSELGALGALLFMCFLCWHLPWRQPWRFQTVNVLIVIALAMDSLFMASFGRPWLWFLLACLPALRDCAHAQAHLGISTARDSQPA